MKGMMKVISRTPHLLGSKVGMSSKSNDAEFDELNRKFTSVEELTSKLMKDSQSFRESVSTMLTSQSDFSLSFAQILSPLSSTDTSINSSAQTIKNIDAYNTTMVDLKESLLPELELIDTRVLAPLKEFQEVLKKIRKSITKRDHKLVDYDRYNNSYSKLRDKKEKTLNDEKNLFKLEQEFEQASSEYNHHNDLLKTELPTFFQYVTSFITPLFVSFYYMQLNVIYIMMEKLKGFCEEEGVSLDGLDAIEEGYRTRLGDAAERLEEMSITKRFVSTARMMQQSRQTSADTGLSATPASLSRSTTSASNMSVTAPPPYSPSTNSSTLSAKRAPPPPPGKPKPKNYVTALYDFVAQADGDLSFKAGDKIELIEKTESTEDWWTGKLNGVQGVFPANYVQSSDGS